MTTPGSVPPPMKLRVYKATDDEHAAAQAAAKLEGEHLAEVIRRSLAHYAARIERKHAKALKAGKKGRARKAA